MINTTITISYDPNNRSITFKAGHGDTPRITISSKGAPNIQTLSDTPADSIRKIMEKTPIDKEPIRSSPATLRYLLRSVLSRAADSENVIGHLQRVLTFPAKTKNHQCQYAPTKESEQPVLFCIHCGEYMEL